MFRYRFVSAILLLAAASCVQAGCPYSSGSGPLHAGADRKLLIKDMNNGSVEYEMVEADLLALMTDSQDYWPADFGNYGPFFIRLAWHCSGSYRSSDGRGGCDGGRIRYSPERSWEDNTNLDKALTLLQPIKLKYGPSLSWGDLIILSANVAIKSMGGPVLGFCGGRQDDDDGSASLKLGDSEEQKEVSHCLVNGDCGFPLGPTTVGLIYVNPGGHLGVPEPKGSVPDIRKTFANMGMNDRETVALIGGGHSFGKTHGACPTGPGPNPTEAPEKPYPGTCGSGAIMGVGPNTFTSGFEGAWTTKPTEWTNLYFKNLLDIEWVKEESPAGAIQWVPSTGTPKVIMLTSDLALLEDPSYLAIVKEFAADIKALEKEFAAAWYKLTSQDMGPASRCLGDAVPPPQPFQMPLPSKMATSTNVPAIRENLLAYLSANSDKASGHHYTAQFATLAYQCACTFRSTNYRGGCNGARIRFPPQSEWPSNAGVIGVLDLLNDIKTDDISWADLIVLAGQTAIEHAGGHDQKFCPGRVDADDGAGSEALQPRLYFNATIASVRDNQQVMGLEPSEMVAIAARPRSPLNQYTLGYSGTYTTDPNTLSNAYFKSLITEEWERQPDPEAGKEMEVEYKAKGKDLYMIDSDLALLFNPIFKNYVEAYASDEDLFQRVFATAWTKLMNADRFKGPNGNVCYQSDESDMKATREQRPVMSRSHAKSRTRRSRMQRER